MPSLYRQILKYCDLDAGDLATLRHGLAAGEALSPALLEQWRAATGKEIYEAFGMSECSTFVSNHAGMPIRPGSPGKPQRGRSIASFRAPAPAEPLPAGEVGLLAIHRSDPGLMLGYWRRPEEEASAFRGDWFVGGDLAAFDEDGYLWHHGRADDVMNAGGYRVSPLEVEAALADCPGIAEVAVGEHRVRDRCQHHRRLRGAAGGRHRRRGCRSSPMPPRGSPPTSARSRSSSSPPCRAAPTASSCAGRSPLWFRRSTMHDVLAGLRVVEAASFIAGPSCGLHLAQLGAEVIRIDPVGGGPDYHRWPLTPEGASLYWEGLNKGKKSIAIDLARPEGRELAQRLAAAPGPEAGLFVTNFPSDGFLSHAKLAALRPISSRCASWAGATARRRSITPSMPRSAFH